MRDGCTAAPRVVARAGILVHSTCSWAIWPSWGALNHGLQFQQAVPTGTAAPKRALFGEPLSVSLLRSQRGFLPVESNDGRPTKCLFF